MNLDQTYIVINSSGKTKRTEVIFSEFPDGEIHCVIENVKGINKSSILVVHSLYPNQNSQILKLLILTDLLLELRAKSIAVFSPYLPYARQDKRHLPGEALTAKTICKLLSNSGISMLFTFDCHFMKGKLEDSVDGLKIRNYSLGDCLIAEFKDQIIDKDFDIIGPDKGSNYLVKELGSKNMHKKRGEYSDIGNGRSHRDIVDLQFDHIKLDSNNVVIIDDMISTGGTILRAVNNLKALGVKNVYCLAIHGLFLGNSYSELLKIADKVMVSDTIPCEASSKVVLDFLNNTIINDWYSAE